MAGLAMGRATLARRRETVMRLRPLMLLIAMLVCTPALAYAQDFGVMESAETINKNNFKLRGNPMFVFGKDADATTGVAIAAGYGFTPRFDAEAVSYTHLRAHETP